MTAPSAAATGATAESTPAPLPNSETTQPTPPATTEVFGTRLGDILGQLDIPTEVRDQLTPKPETTATAPEAQPAAPAPTSVAGTTPPPAEPTAPIAAAADPSDTPVPDEWPESAKARVAEETRKRKERTTAMQTATSRAEMAERQAQQLQAQLQDLATRPPTMPTPQDPLVNVRNGQQLGVAMRDNEQLLEFATLNPDGLANVLVGREANGQEIRKDYTADEMARIRLHADRMLRAAIPAKAEYLRQQAEVEAQVRTVHPKLFEANTQEEREASWMVQQLPEITRYPDWQMWIGDAMVGRNLRIQQQQQTPAAPGNGTAAAAPASPAVAAILAGQRQPPLAPSVPVVRSPSAAPARGANNVDLKQAQEDFTSSTQTTGDLEKYIEQIRAAQRTPEGVLV